MSPVSIQSFADAAAESFFETGRVGKGVGWASVSTIVNRKLDMLDYAAKLIDLRSPPGNRLEALVGDLAGFYSIRVNDQWRVVFKWTDAGPSEIHVVDYHR
ncbi:MAG: type II toxin-antitoxin system RelE/ParE family toxin [Deltaproteobacteria bacterium]|nr:type II toxin-antitoxin system RelE/ParE family toxin [Deltaproteobacteria bacterium]